MFVAMKITKLGDASIFYYNLQEHINASPLSSDIISSDDYEVDEYVFGNDGKVVSSKIRSLMTEAVGSNFAVLMLSKHPDGTPYLGLVHVHNNKHGFSALYTTVEELREKTHDAAIQAFICGGAFAKDLSAQSNLRRDLLKTMQILKIEIVDDISGSDTKIEIEQANGPNICLNITVARAGFDKNLNPYALYKATRDDN